MSKELSYNMSKTILEMAQKPLRSREEAVLLLLYTVRMFDAEEFLHRQGKEKVVVYVDKMNRIFYILENKIFSMQFPFCIELNNGKLNKIYGLKSGLDIDSILVSILIRIFEKLNADSCSLENFFDELLGENEMLKNIDTEQLWIILKFILTYDLGYLRYDYDEKHCNGKMHPLNHLDICLDDCSAYKIGLEKAIDYAMLKDILDTTTSCSFLKKDDKS